MSRLNDEDERLVALNSLAAAEDEAADDDVGDFSVDFGPPKSPTPELGPVNGPEYSPAALAPDEAPGDEMAAAPLPPPPAAAAASTPAAPTRAAGDTSAERLEALQALADDSGDERVRAAFERDRQAALNEGLRDAMGAAVSGRQVRAMSLPSEAAMEAGLLQRGDARRQALIRAYAQQAKPVDDSLAQRRKDLSEEARLRNELARLKFEEAKRAAGTGEGLKAGRLELDRTNASNLAKYREGLLANAAKKKGAGAKPHVVVKEGDLAGVPEQYRNVVKAIVEGRMEAPKASSRFGAQVLEYVNQVDPTFDATRFGAYKKVAESQATDKSITAMGVARHHIRTARAALPKNMDTVAFNKIKQAALGRLGDKEFIRFNIATPFVAHEVARINNIDDAAGKEMVEHLLESAQSPEQLVEAFDTIDELIAGKQAGVQEQREHVAPTKFGEAPKAAAPAHGAPSAPFPMTPSPASGGVRVRRKRDGVTRVLSPEEAADLMKRRGAEFEEVR